MRFATYNHIPLPDLQAMADGILEDTLNDMDFLQTLARQKCILVPPSVVQAQFDGTLVEVTSLLYTSDGDLDKPRILLAVARFLEKQRNSRFGRRFNI